MASFQEIVEKFPFLSLCKHGDTEIIGIIQNYTTTVVSIYVYNYLKCVEDKQEFLELGDEWWWGSNRVLPVNLVVGPKFKKFSHCLRNYNAKDFELIQGTPVSLQNIITKRIKRRQIQLVQKF
jgi:hypothetical protein